MRSTLPPPLDARCSLLRRRLPLLIVAVVVGWLGSASTAQAQISGRDLLAWCQGALGSSVTSTIDAFQCNAYLQAVIDQRRAAGAELETCLGERPDATDLMARLMPELERRAAEAPDSLNASAGELVGNWLAENCDAAGGPGPTSPPVADGPPSTDPPGNDRPDDSTAADASVELAVWQATQRITGDDRRIEALERYLEDYPDGRFAEYARLQLAGLREPADPPQADLPQPNDLPQDDDRAALDDPAPPADEPPAADDAQPADDPPSSTEPADAVPEGPEAEATAEAIRLENSLTNGERREIQRALAGLGLYGFGIDGIFGRGTRTGIRAFQESLDEDPTGYLTKDQMEALLRLAPPAPEVPLANPVYTPPQATPVSPGGPAGYQSFTLVNRGQTAVIAVHASPTTHPTWDHDRLYGRMLLPGTRTVVEMAEYPSACGYDVLVIDEFGIERRYMNIDLCRTSTIEYP